MHRAHEHAVFKRGETEVKRGKKMWVRGRGQIGTPMHRGGTRLRDIEVGLLRLKLGLYAKNSRPSPEGPGWDGI